jgi:hypothetical protein
MRAAVWSPEEIRLSVFAMRAAIWESLAKLQIWKARYGIKLEEERRKEEILRY